MLSLNLWNIQTNSFLRATLSGSTEPLWRGSASVGRILSPGSNRSCGQACGEFYEMYIARHYKMSMVYLRLVISQTHLKAPVWTRFYFNFYKASALLSNNWKNSLRCLCTGILLPFYPQTAENMAEVGGKSMNRSPLGKTFITNLFH